MRREGQKVRVRMFARSVRVGRVSGSAQCLLHVQTLPTQHADPHPGRADVLTVKRKRTKKGGGGAKQRKALP